MCVQFSYLSCKAALGLYVSVSRIKKLEFMRCLLLNWHDPRLEQTARCFQLHASILQRSTTTVFELYRTPAGRKFIKLNENVLHNSFSEEKIVSPKEEHFRRTFIAYSPQAIFFGPFFVSFSLDFPPYTV